MNFSKYDDSVQKLLVQAEQSKRDGDFASAIQTLHQVIVAVPECTEAYEELGDNFLSLRKLSEAEKAISQALKINSCSANAHYLLGFLYSLEQKWQKSIEELQRADQLLPNHPEILRCLGWSVYNGNRSAQGIAVLERSEALSPADPNILCDLGVCYLNSALFTKAKETFERVIRIAPHSDQATECARFLELLRTRQLA